MSTDNQKPKEYTFAISHPLGAVDGNGNTMSGEALENAVRHFNERLQSGRWIVGEFGAPSADVISARTLQVDERNVAIRVTAVEMTDTGIVAKVVPFGPYASVVQKFIDDGSLERDEIGFRIRMLVPPDKIKDGIITEFVPVTVDLVDLK